MELRVWVRGASAVGVVELMVVATEGIEVLKMDVCMLGVAIC
jgi:hypothetical protein